MSGILAMMGGSRPSPVTITNQSCIKGVVDPNDALASYSVQNDRTVRSHAATLETWLDASYSVGDFEVRATLNSGNTPSGNLGTWNNLATTRTWSLSQTVIGSKSCSLLIEIGYAGLNVALDTATITIDADVG